MKGKGQITASEMGKRGMKSRWGKMTPEQRSEEMKKVRNKNKKPNQSST